MNSTKGKHLLNKKITFSNVKFKDQLDKINNYEEHKIKAKYEQEMHNPDRTKFLFEYIKRIKK